MIDDNNKSIIATDTNLIKFKKMYVKINYTYYDNEDKYLFKLSY